MQHLIHFKVSCVHVYNTNYDILPPAFPNHTSAVLASLVLFIILVLAAVVYSKCHLNFKLWYKNSYGEYEINGKSKKKMMDNVF